MNFESETISPSKAAATSRPNTQQQVKGWPSYQQAVKNTSAPSSMQRRPAQPGTTTSAMPQQRVYKKVTNTGTGVNNFATGKGKPLCPTCKSSTSGCITLKGFASNSAALSPQHKQQLRQLAITILKQKSNSVVASGYSSSPKNTPHSASLSKRRAIAVINELKKQLAQLRPMAVKNILWKALSKWNVRMSPATPAANNRRVVICLRKI